MEARPGSTHHKVVRNVSPGDATCVGKSEEDEEEEKEGMPSRKEPCRATEPHHVCKGVEAEDSSPAGRSVGGLGWGGLGHWRTPCPAAGLIFYPNTQWKVFTKTLPPWRKCWQPYKGREGENEELVSGGLGRQGCPTEPSGVRTMSHPFHQ